MMKIKVFLFTFLTGLTVLGLLGCKTTPIGEEGGPADYSSEHVIIQVISPGLSTTKDSLFKGVEFQVYTGDNYPTEKWTIEIINDRDNSIKKFSGSGQVPSLWSWDGMDNRGEKAADGKYRARLSVWFPDALTPIVQESAVFILDSVGPVGTITFSEELFSPDNDGINDMLDIKVTVADELSEVKSWLLNIYDSHGAEIKRFYSDQNPTGMFTWDGKDKGELMVSSASDYDAVLTSWDSFGNEGTTRNVFSTDLLVFKEGENLRIRVNSIIFKPYTADFMDVEAEQKQSNIETLDLIAEKLKKFPNYKITLEGHAVSVFWNSPSKAEKENKDVLIPLSEARADSIRNALIERGVKGDSMTVKGMGASNPIVPFSDLQNRWKNRRVTFILTK
jgi:outer membrane protein OmpA-like peptidoglycan-associated protein